MQRWLAKQAMMGTHGGTGLFELAKPAAQWLSHPPSIIAGIVALLSILAVSIRVINGYLEYRKLRSAKDIQDRQSFGQIAFPFTPENIRESLNSYIVPDCAQSDPSEYSDITRVAAVREDVMVAVDRFIEAGGEHRHLLILADSGMGKTTFCINLLNRSYKANQKKLGKTYAVAVVPLGRGSKAIERIRAIPNQNETVLLLDAFDEDVGAIDDAPGRLMALMEAASDFRTVIVTCRSQFFENDASVPRRTGVAVIRPRKGGEAGEYRFSKLYLMPFSKAQIDRYLRAQFPVWRLASFRNRPKARRLVEEIPDLSVRPMLLALLPDLVRSKADARELFDLYDFMISQWVTRESHWIAPDELLPVSKRLAVYIFTRRRQRDSDRVTPEELHAIAAQLDVPEPVWKYLGSRSLLNRDSDGNFKFSHRTIMEHLFVVAAIEGASECFDVVWTPFMRDLFVSWGCTIRTEENFQRAREILAMDLGALGLSPLSTPLRTPDIVAASRIASSLTTTVGRGRVPHEWRADSLRISKSQSTSEVRDLQHDLIWTIPTDKDLDEPNLLRSSYAQVVDIEGSNGRLPSIDEFASLVTGVDDTSLVHPREFYWVGDQLGRLRHLCVSIGDEALAHEAIRSVVRLEAGPRSGVWLWVYEVLTLPTSFGAKAPAFEARTVLVREGDAFEKQAIASQGLPLFAAINEPLGGHASEAARGR